MKIKNCCDTDNLKQIKEIYHSNSDDFILYQCPKCEKYWLYRRLELDWWNNIQLNEDNFETWYIGICDDDLNKVYSCEFEKIYWMHGFMYISSDFHPQSDCKSDWKRIYDR